MRVIVSALFLVILLSKSSCENIIDEGENTIETSSNILNTILSDCLTKLSYTCVQKKVLLFVDRLDTVNSIKIFQGWDLIKKSSNGARSVESIHEEDLQSVGSNEEILRDMLDNRIISFFEHRSLRVSLPSSLNARSVTPTMDIALEDDTSEGRLKKKKKLKLKALLLGVLLFGGIKLIKLMPIILALIKLKAIKAIIIAGISLLITVGGAARGLIQRKLALFQQSPMQHVKTVEVWLAPMKGGHGHSSGGGGGHSSYSSGGGGGGGYSGDSYSNAASGGGYADSYSTGHGSSSSGGYDSYSVGGAGYGGGGGGGGGGWSSKSDATQSDAHNLAYSAHH